MRKLILSVNITMDGFMAGPGHELDWHFLYWNGEMAKLLTTQLSRADTIVLGRVTYEAMAGYWPLALQANSFPREDIAFATMMNSYQKVVFTKTRLAASWNNTRVVNRNVRREIIKMKQKKGNDIIIYGSGLLVASLLKWELIDEFMLWVHPVLLGRGKALFKGLQDKLSLELAEVRSFNTGVVLLHYRTVIDQRRPINLFNQYSFANR